jgi:formate-nitrite transporter family protein
MSRLFHNHPGEGGEAANENGAESEREEQEVHDRSSPSGKVVYKSILKEADEELGRPTAALFWSGLAAGLSMGFSLISEGLLRHYLPHAEWAPLLSKLGYTAGFVIVILGRQQLFTENTLTPMLPLMKRRDAGTLANVLRLWGVVLAANLLGTLAVSFVAVRSSTFDPEVREEFLAMGHEAMKYGFWVVLLRGIFAGWLIALLVWMLPYAESTHFFVILFITWIIGIGHFSHVIAGAVEVFGLAWAGQKAWTTVVSGFFIPALVGNILGGVTLVAAVNHAQVCAGQEEQE